MNRSFGFGSRSSPLSLFSGIYLPLSGGSMSGPIVIAQGTLTGSSTPILDLSSTWNNAATTFVGLNYDITNTASSVGSLIARWRVNGVAMFSINYGGLCTIQNNVVASAFYCSSTNGTFSIASDTFLYRQAANIFFQRNGANAQAQWLANAYTDASNYEIGFYGWESNELRFGTRKLGTGSARVLAFQTDGITRFSLGAAGSITIADANNFAFNTTTGSKIGTGTTQKLGFWNAAPIVQPSGTGETVGFTGGGGTGVTDASTFTGNVGSTAYRLSDIVKALKNSGLIAA